MKFRAMVADPKTGREFVEMIPANDEAEARVVVKQKGLLLTKLEPSKDEKVSHPIQYAAPLAPMIQPERYPRSSQLIAAIRGIAFVSYLLAGSVILAAIATANDKTATVSPFYIASLGISLFVSALLLHATSAGLRFVRDIAENSFKH